VQKFDGAMIFERKDVAAEHLLHQPRHDLDAGEVATVDSAVE
jgi:hypothetical protein